MNIFRLAGDLSHLLAIIILLVKIWKTKSCAGLSGKSQVLFGVVYCTRYLDLFTSYVSPYNTVMKILFIGTSAVTIYLIYGQFRDTNETNRDSFRIELLLIPCALLAMFVYDDDTSIELLWAFSIYLEAVAILPQFFLMYKTGKAESITNYYLFALGSYRAWYLVNWGYRYVAESHYDLIPIYAGIVQTILYCGFFCLYITQVSTRNNLANNLTISPLSLGSEDNLKGKNSPQTKENNIYVLMPEPKAYI